MTQLKLSDRELNDPLWLKIEEHLKEALTILRKSNDNMEHDIEHTAFIRGKIAVIKEILRINEKTKDI